MRIVFHLSEPGNYFPVYKNDIPVELFGLDGAPFSHLFNRVFDAYSEFFPEAETDVIGQGGQEVVSVITDKCDLLNVPSSNLFTRVFIFSAFCAAMGQTGFCLFHPGNHFPDNMESFAPVLRSVMADAVASSGLVFYSFKGKPDRGPKKRFYLKKGEKLIEAGGAGLFSVKEICYDADIDAWQKEPRNKGADPDEVFFPGSGVFSFHPAALMEAVTAGNENLLEMYHLLVKAWEDGGSIKEFLKESVVVLDGFSLLDLVRGIDEKYFVTVGTGLFRADTFGDMLGLLELNEDGNYISGPAETHGVKRSAVINKSDKRIVVTGMKDVLVLSDGESTGVRGTF